MGSSNPSHPPLSPSVSAKGHMGSCSGHSSKQPSLPDRGSVCPAVCVCVSGVGARRMGLLWENTASPSPQMCQAALPPASVPQALTRKMSGSEAASHLRARAPHPHLARLLGQCPGSSSGRMCRGPGLTQCAQAGRARTHIRTRGPFRHPKPAQTPRPYSADLGHLAPPPHRET